MRTGSAVDEREGLCGPDSRGRRRSCAGALTHALGVALLLALAPSAWPVERDALAALLEQTRSEQNMPGLRAAVRFPDGRIVRAAVGLADVEAGTSLDDTIGMPGGSTGKMFVAALTMLLVEDGRLSLDDPASKYLGDTSWYRKLPSAAQIRVRHLLSHSAGLRDYPYTLRFTLALVRRALRHGSAYFTPEEFIGYAGRKALFAPGEGYAYTDIGYLVLGRLIEAATGRDYYELLRERILVPCGLAQVRAADTSVLAGIAPGYTAGARNLKKDGRMKFDPSSEWTGGGLITNPTMLVEFLGALAQGRLVTPASLQTMIESGWRDPHTPGAHYGLGLFVTGHGQRFGHGGLWPGYRTHVTHDASSGITIAVQTNRDGRVDLEGLIRRIAALE